jgi:hypothetical protein
MIDEQIFCYPDPIGKVSQRKKEEMKTKKSGFITCASCGSRCVVGVRVPLLFCAVDVCINSERNYI